MSFLTKKMFPIRTCLTPHFKHTLTDGSGQLPTSEIPLPSHPILKVPFLGPVVGLTNPLYIGRNAAHSGPVFFPSTHPILLLHPFVIAGLFVWIRSSFFLLCLLASARNPDITWSSYNQSFLQPQANKSICPIPSVMTTLSTYSTIFILQAYDK